MKHYSSDLTDSQWGIIKMNFPAASSGGINPKENLTASNMKNNEYKNY